VKSTFHHRSRHPEKIMPKPSKEFISPKTLIAPAGAGYSHIAKVNSGTIVYPARYRATHRAS
jgi:hypothetical protein